MKQPKQYSFHLFLLSLLKISADGLCSNYQKLSNVKSVHHARYAADDMTMRLNPTSFANTDYIITEFPRPALRRIPNQPIDRTEFETPEFQSLTAQMITIMYEAQGVGLAAPQIGMNKMLFVYNPSGSDPNSRNMQRIVCNPNITKYSEEIDIEQEGCLSLRSDDCAGNVARSSWIEVTYQNEMGQQTRRRLKGFEARVFQHEYDHLQGILCWDRFSPEDREKVRANIDKLMTLYPEQDAITDPDKTVFQSIQPPPVLTAGRMPPLDNMDEAKEEPRPTQVKAAPKVSGFGGGGGNKAAKKKKKK